MIRILLPQHLQSLAGCPREVMVDIASAATRAAALDALEKKYPALGGAIRDHSGRRRALVRFFACGDDLSHEPEEALLPEAVANGSEPLVIIGAIAGG